MEKITVKVRNEWNDGDDDPGQAGKITTAVLKGWFACNEGLRRFTELFPDGADLKTAVWGLIADGREDWAGWLYRHCRNDERFMDQAAGGVGNTGAYNSGNWNTGEYNSGDFNSGFDNSGNMNSGYYNTGFRNSGGGNSGNWNSGWQNSGFHNTGDWNSGSYNTGWFNSITPDQSFAFNKPVSRMEWLTSTWPFFIHDVRVTHWVRYDRMTGEQKAESPDAEKHGGRLYSRSYKEAWRKAWDEADDVDRRRVLSLPNFDPEVFLEITGIDVRVELGI